MTLKTENNNHDIENWVAKLTSTGGVSTKTKANQFFDSDWVL